MVQAKTILNYVYAFFRKKSKRVNYDLIIKKNKLISQNYKCNICGKEITIKNSELDHNIPWAYVGDELGTNNLQMLCVDCNRHKSKNRAYNLKMFLIEK